MTVGAGTENSIRRAAAQMIGAAAERPECPLGSGCGGEQAEIPVRQRRRAANTRPSRTLGQGHDSEDGGKEGRGCTGCLC